MASKKACKRAADNGESSKSAKLSRTKDEKSQAEEKTTAPLTPNFVRFVDELMTRQPPSGDIWKLNIGANRYLVHARFNGEELIHIREYSSSGTKEYPTKRGVCLTPARLTVLRYKLEEIDDQVKLLDFPHPQPSPLYKMHLGRGIFVTVGNGYRCVDLRRYWRPEGSNEEKPSRSGIALTLKEWVVFKEKLGELMALSPHLAEAMPCSYSESHQNQIGMLECAECTPFGW